MIDNFIIRPFYSYSIHSLKAKREVSATYRTMCSSKDNVPKTSYGKLFKGLPLTKASEEKQLNRIQSASFNPNSQKFDSIKEPFRPSTTTSTKRKFNFREKKDNFAEKFLDFEIDNKVSEKFDNIYYMKVPYKEALNNVHVPKNSTSIKSSSKEYNKIYKLVKEIFVEIEVSPLSIFVIKSPRLEHYQIYILENELLPISRCCDALIIIDIHSFKRGYIKCSGNGCKNPIIFEFVVPSLTSEITFKQFEISDTNDKKIRKNISRNIISGKYRYNKLVGETIKETNTTEKSKPIYSKKNNARPWTSQETQNLESNSRQLKFRKLKFNSQLVRNKSLKNHFNRLVSEKEELDNDKTIDDIRKMIENL